MDNFEGRKFVLLAIFLFVGVSYIIRLFYLQVIDDSFILSANNQTLRHVTQYPARGLIYDRNGKLMVYNEAAYDLMVIPRQVENIDTMAFCKLIGITKEQFIERMDEASEYSGYKATVFEEQILSNDFSTISESLYKFPGFYGQKRTIRKYPEPIAAHVLGYIGEVDKTTIEKNKYYRKGDFIGISGLEKFYENQLRGVRGVKLQLVDVHNVIKGSYKDGEIDTLAIKGKDLTLTIDAELQAYGEKLMINKKGSIVAIEPKTGEILTFVSSPTYDPNLLVGRQMSKNYLQLSRNDSLNPLFNRALMAQYPPGSIFKMLQSLVALQLGVINFNTSFSCNKSLVGCHDHPHPSSLQLAIQYSCNPYFFNVFKKIVMQNKAKSIFKDSELGLAEWRPHMISFGLGQKLNIDLPSVKSGSIPSVEFYDKIYGHNRWAFSTIYSVSIGQGEVEVIPLQMANITAIIANRGYYVTPHLVKNVENDTLNREFSKKHYASIDEKFYDPIIEAMQQVVEGVSGTARRARIDSIAVCGKTGTAENPHGEDHAVFIAFAPKDDPKIAIAVFVENSGFGGSWAAPIASLLMEKYLKGEVNRPEDEKRLMEANFLDPKKQNAKKKK